VGQAGIGLETHAFLWEDGVMVDLGTLPGGTGAVAYGLNNRGQVVGWAGLPNGYAQAVLWQDGLTIDLGILPGGRYSFASSINERGDIVGISENAAHEAVWVRWTRRQNDAHSVQRLVPHPRSTGGQEFFIDAGE
jgi:probable HAF family extracellular repeat protein